MRRSDFRCWASTISSRLCEVSFRTRHAAISSSGVRLTDIGPANRVIIVFGSSRTGAAHTGHFPFGFENSASCDATSQRESRRKGLTMTRECHAHALAVRAIRSPSAHAPIASERRGSQYVLVTLLGGT